MEFLRIHPYLVANIPILLIVLLVTRLAFSREHREWVIFSGLSCVPCALLARFHDVDYWNPVRLGGIVPGVEDIIFCFIVGSMSWMAATWRFRSRLDIYPNFWASLLRYAVFSLGFSLLFLALYFTQVSSMTATVVVTAVALIVLMILRRNLWPLTVVGAAGFTFFYVIIVKIQFWIWPDYRLNWTTGGLWEMKLLGIPAGEIAWAVSFASFWPVFMVFVLDACLGKPEMAEKSGASRVCEAASRNLSVNVNEKKDR